MLGSGLAEVPRLQINGCFVEQQRQDGDFDPKDLMAAFAAVFKTLPDELEVWPTGNYHYFSFQQDGVRWRGNFRLDAADRDRGLIHFSLHGDGESGRAVGGVFGKPCGVKVTQVVPLIYIVHFQGKAVVFRLNNLSGVVPGDLQMRGGETYLGPIADESGFGFFLLWEELASVFLYILDDARQAEPLEQSAVSEQIKVGLRSGFAFYRDRYRPRWILIGVRTADVIGNSSFDGPFDQIPENSVDGETLKRALEKSRPGRAGRIDRFGNSADLKTRVLVRPYVLYSRLGQLSGFDGCAARASRPDEYYRCFSTTKAPGTRGRK